MKVLKYGFGFALIAGFALNASCGSSRDSGSSSAGASSIPGAGDSATGAGASSQTAGSSSLAGDTSSGGSGNMAQGGAPMSGGAGRGGTGRAGAPASGGAPSNPADCPMENLAANAMCSLLASSTERCWYGDESCHCRPNNSGTQGGAGGAPTTDSGHWTCTTVCPTIKPSVGTDCTAGLACPYAG
ncbi:MAG TPA: hypothetical protein VGL19_01255, partial [Polyangiaceae bacterium]